MVHAERPLVSVIIPTYKRPDTLSRAIESVLNQTYQNLEVIVVDDNNKDDPYRQSTKEFMSKYTNNKKIIYLKHKKNKNGATARNTGLKKSKGKYVSFLDDDDEYKASKIEEQVFFLDNNEQYLACYCLSKKYLDNKEYYKVLYKKSGDISFDILMNKIEMNTSCLMFYRTALDEIKGFDENFIRHQDYEILLRYLQKHKIGCIDKYLLKIHTDNREKSFSFEDMKLLKEEYLEMFDDVISRYSQKKQNEITRNHYFELSYIALTYYKVIPCLKYLIKSKPTPEFLYKNRQNMKRALKRIFKVVD